MVSVLGTQIEAENFAKRVESFDVEIETDDGNVHTVMFRRDEDELSDFNPDSDVLFVSDIATEYTAPTSEAAVGISTALASAKSMLKETAEAQDLTYTLAPERYHMNIATYGARVQHASETISRLTPVDSCTIVASGPKNDWERIVVCDWNNKYHEFLFDGGSLIDGHTSYSLIDANTLDASFAALRTAFSEMLSRGHSLETGVNLEVYTSGAVRRYNHEPLL